MQNTNSSPLPNAEETNLTPPVDGAELIKKPNDFVVAWKDDMTIQAQSIPPRSFYKIDKNTADEFEVTLFLDTGVHEFLRPYAFMLNILIKKTDRPAGPIGCSLPKVKDNISDEELQNAHYDISVRPRVNYSYSGGQYSNPNPWTPEVEKILGAVWNSLKIGNCK